MSRPLNGRPWYEILYLNSLYYILNEVNFYCRQRYQQFCFFNMVLSQKIQHSSVRLSSKLRHITNSIVSLFTCFKSYLWIFQLQITTSNNIVYICLIMYLSHQSSNLMSTDYCYSSMQCDELNNLNLKHFKIMCLLKYLPNILHLLYLLNYCIVCNHWLSAIIDKIVPALFGRQFTVRVLLRAVFTLM